MNLHRMPSAALAAAMMLAAGAANAFTTFDGQAWNYSPDAWTRANDATTSHFGWDVLERTGPTLGFTKLLDDTSPDVSTGAITASNPRFYQVNTTTPFNGHVAGSFNYYSIFDNANDVITATAPAGGSGGFTTVVLQVLGGLPAPTGANPIEDLTLEMLSGGWTLQKSLYGVEANGSGVYWKEWTSPTAAPTFSIGMTSPTPHRSLDAIQIDTFWSPSSAAVNARVAIGVPEPAGALMAASGLMALALRRRKG